MNRSLVLRLIQNDWYLTRTQLAIIALAGGLAVGAMWLRNDVAGFIGIIGALLTLVLLGNFMPVQTIVNERKRQHLAFVMSLPISPMEYTTAKMLWNVSVFIVLWLAIVGGVIGTLASAGIFDGVIPVGVVIALAPFVAFCLILSVAIVVESEFWAIVTQVACNVSYSFAWFLLIRNPRIRQDLEGPVAVWSEPILWILAVEIVVIVIALGATFYFQSRKTDFI